ncbi:MAG TPA: DUF2142 domain-containing protein [Solirubrobacteraceae bacterium]|nr:DUF2142 domain-containing protein [Solirubrobacteraceae bacterium]
MTAVKGTFALGIVLTIAVVVLTLSQSPLRVVRATASPRTIVTTAIESAEICQAKEALPAGVTAIRLATGAYVGSPVRVRVSSSSGVVTEGKRGPNWTGNSVTVPVTPLTRAVSPVKVCVSLAPNSELIYVQGVPSSAKDSAVTPFGRTGGRITIEYLAPSRDSWWSRAVTVARHMGLGHALSGTWVAGLAAVLMAAVGLLAVGLTIREASSEESSESRVDPPLSGLRRVPSAAWICVLVAFLNAFAWSLIVPPLQGKDEVDHFAYVQDLAENHVIPSNGQENGVYSAQLTQVMGALHYFTVTHAPQVRAISTVAEQRALDQAVHAGASMRGSGEAGIATAEPPLFYVLQTVPYELGQGNILVQVQLMRFLSALFGALTALFVFLFLRELLPRSPWAATVGALCAALQPLFAFISGSLNPDALLYTVSAGVLFCLARAFHTGLTPRLAVAFGLLTAIGCVTKLNFVAIAVGALLGIAVLAVREVRSKGVGGLLSPALATLVGLSPLILYAIRNALTSRPTFGFLSGSLLAAPSMGDEFSYVWQMYLPRLPGMTQYFAGINTTKDIWFDRSVGLYGWMDTVFPTWVDNLALIPASAIALLCGRRLFVRRDSLIAHAAEIGVYAVMGVAVLAMVGISSFHGDALNHGPAFVEPRYLVPLLPLLGAAVSLAVLGAGRRWAPVAGAAVVVLFLGHDIFSQLQVLARYYG